MKVADRKPPPVVEGTVLPLINVVFLLLIFFMLAGRVAEPDPPGVDPPPMAAGEDYAGGQMTVALAADGTLTLDGEPVAAETIRGHLDGRETVPAVVVKADGAVAAGSLLEVLDALRAAGVDDLSLVARSEP